MMFYHWWGKGATYMWNNQQCWETYQRFQFYGTDSQKKKYLGEYIRIQSCHMLQWMNLKDSILSDISQ